MDMLLSAFMNCTMHHLIEEEDEEVSHGFKGIEIVHQTKLEAATMLVKVL
jgi:hypothetical protein